GEEEELEKIINTEKFKPDKGFSGAEKGSGKKEARSGPVEFEKDVEEDPFGFDRYMSTAKEGKRNPLDKIGNRGTMHAAGTGNYEMYKEGGSSRSRVEFDRSRRSPSPS